MRIRILSLFLALSVLCALTKGWAMTFYPTPFPDRVKEAPTIVRGKIGDSSVDWAVGSDGVRRLYTFYPLDVTEALKGEFDETSITIREIGGEKDGVGLDIDGAAHFTEGEDVVIFLNDKNSDGSFDVHGMMLGKYNVIRNNNGQEVLAGPGITRDESISQKWTIESLRHLIQSQTTQRVKPRLSPKPLSSPSISPVPRKIQPPAPVLQPQEEEHASLPWRFLLPVGLLLIGLGSTLTWKFYKRRG